MSRIDNLDAGIGWKALAKTLQKVQKAVNSNCPVKGHGISINETDTGAIISLDPKTADDPNNPGNQIAVGTVKTVTLFDANGNPITLNVWTDGNNPGTSRLSWQPITVVNPSDCSQSTVKVLTEP